MSYVPSPFVWARRRTREVLVGDVGIGGANPIRVQSMTTTDTRDTDATVAQVARLAEAGCEIVRITAPGIKDAENLGPIKQACLERGVRVPLVADIHFTPNAALEAALHVEKVRINPGNYADKKRFEVREYSDAQYADELARVAERFLPLVRRCKELGRALRIGTNHGSLSDRIMNRYGDSPRGMVESALEFLDVCEAESFHAVVFSMKASNPQVAIHAYRLLAARLFERGGGADSPGYPFHLGVTEAGDGDDGRVKSAIGIGALLEDGIGETIRVSLTEDPVKEVPVARALARRYDERMPMPALLAPGADFVVDPFAHERRETREVIGSKGSFGIENAYGIGGNLGIGGGSPVRVELDLGAVPTDANAACEALAAMKAGLGDLACEGLSLDLADEADVEWAKAFAEAAGKRGLGWSRAFCGPPALVSQLGAWADRLVFDITEPDITELPGEWTEAPGLPIEWCVRVPPTDLARTLEACLAQAPAPALISFLGDPPTHTVRLGVAWLRANGLAALPVVLRHRSDPLQSVEAALLRAATDLGGPLCDGIGDAVCLGGLGTLERTVSLAYRILQGARLRTSWTEFISCPSCGRTLFDLEETTARIKQRTQHLPGLKIAVMGCIVNGPGEMADADFGYVGSGVGRVSLYVGHECVVRNVPEQAAPDRLVELIRAHGRWVDP